MTAASSALCAGNGNASASASPLRGQNRNHNYDLKNLLQGDCLRHGTPPAAAGFYAALAEKGDAAQHGPSHP